jgi:hypothetical protein
MAIVAATTVASAAGAATSTNAPIAASGSVAAITGSSMEVQNANTGQTTVSWTPTTQFSKTVSETVGSITVGTCVSATGTPSTKSKTTIAVRSISVTAASSTGSCARGAGVNGLRGGAPAGGLQFRSGQSGSSSATWIGNGSQPKFAGGNFQNRLGNFAIASGKVTAVNGSTLSVSGVTVSPGSFPRQESKVSEKRTPPKTQNLKLTTSGSTTVMTTQSATASDLAVGDCVVAFGPAASNGSVTADNVRITSTDNSSCAMGFRRFGGGGAPTIFGGGSGSNQGFVQAPDGGGGA